MPEPPRRRLARERDVRLREILEQMLESGERISARRVLKHLPEVRAPSSLTRDPVRGGLLQEFRERQAERLAWTQRGRKQSFARLEKVLAERDRRIVELQHQVQVLVASHRALVQAVGELGGLPSWRKAFQGYERCLDEIAALGAVPEPKAGNSSRRALRTGG